MKRMSKREILFRFDMIDEVSAHIDRFEHGHAVTTVNGVECCLDVTRSERRDLAHPGKVRAYVVSYPNRRGDGTFARGHKQEKDDLDLFLRCGQARRVCLDSVGRDREVTSTYYELFARNHPIGSLINADVVAVYKDKVRMRLGFRVFTTMPIRSFVDRPSIWRRSDLGGFPVPERVEVILRSIDPRRAVVTVSMHGYSRDPKYCNSASGYRRTYDAREGSFKELPWDREAKTE